jgi:hypothetical protein
MEMESREAIRPNVAHSVYAMVPGGRNADRADVA